MPGGGSRKGERRGGRKPGTKNKATVERERLAMLAAEREKLLLEARSSTGRNEAAKAVASDQKLMKEIGFEFTQIFAGMAAYYRPLPDGSNPNANERKFKEYATLAMQGARDFACYESPKLTAVMVGQQVVTKIEVIGGLPDKLDGSFIDAPKNGGGTDDPGRGDNIDEAADTLVAESSGAVIVFAEATTSTKEPHNGAQ